MARRLLLTVVVLGLLLAACGGNDEAAPATSTSVTSAAPAGPADTGIDVDSLASCDDLADASITSTQNLIDEIDRLTLEEQTALLQEPNAEVLVFYQAVSAALEARADVLGCTDARMEQLVLARVDALSATSNVGRLLVESMSGLANDADAASLDRYSFTEIDLTAIDSCAMVADAGVRWTQDLLDFVDGLTIAEQGALSADDDAAVYAALDDLTTALEARSVEIGCSDAVVRELVAGRVGSLTASSEYGRVLLGFFTQTAAGS